MKCVYKCCDKIATRSLVIGCDRFDYCLPHYLEVCAFMKTKKIRRIQISIYKVLGEEIKNGK